MPKGTHLNENQREEIAIHAHRYGIPAAAIKFNISRDHASKILKASSVVLKKLETVEFALKNTQRAASEKFGLSQTMISRLVRKYRDVIQPNSLIESASDESSIDSNDVAEAGPVVDTAIVVDTDEYVITPYIFIFFISIRNLYFSDIGIWQEELKKKASDFTRHVKPMKDSTWFIKCSKVDDGPSSCTTVWSSGLRSRRGIMWPSGSI